jgi:hypothetical protein
MYNGANLFYDSKLNLIDKRTGEKSAISILSLLSIDKKERKNFAIYYMGMSNDFSIEKVKDRPESMYFVGVLSKTDVMCFAPGSKVVVYKEKGTELVSIEDLFENCKDTYIPYISPDNKEGGGIKMSYLAIKSITKLPNNANLQSHRILFSPKASSILFTNCGFVLRGDRKLVKEKEKQLQ